MLRTAKFPSTAVVSTVLFGAGLAGAAVLRQSVFSEAIKAAPFLTSTNTLTLLALSLLAIAAILVWVETLRRRVRRQEIELRKAAQTAQAIRDLSSAIEEASSEEKFLTGGSLQGSEEIAPLLAGFNKMAGLLLQRDLDKREAEARLKRQALFDDLTGLPNRRLFTDRLSQCLAAVRRENRMTALLYIDLDGFKPINDSFGHAAGDLLLVGVTERLKLRVRESDTLARLGSDEFTILLSHVNSKADASKVAQELLDGLSRPFTIEGHEITIGASIGISTYPEPGSEGDDLLQHADSAMYEAKKSGKNRVAHFSKDLGVSVRERLILESELRQALAKQEIQVHYQPEFDLATNSIVRFEALARWTHPKLGPIPPLTFIPIAEESRLIFALGKYMLEHAAREALRWQQFSGHPVQVAVNVSSVEFARESFVEGVVQTLVETGLSAELLQLEITESATLIGIDRTAATMRRLKGLGIGIAMDDFGSGYSCLSYLPKLPFDALKIDRSFINQLVTSAETRSLVGSILSLAKGLGMKVIVEGIENREQLELIAQMGGDEAQGYFLGRPSPNPMDVLRSQVDAGRKNLVESSLLVGS
jgi:diguanylate cyclase (GGDEF)-like protein